MPPILALPPAHARRESGAGPQSTRPSPPVLAGLDPAIRAYYPDLAEGALQPGYAGVRPKVVPQGAPAGDFIVQGPEAHGVPGLVNFYGIESPGLTASLPLADLAAAKLGLPPLKE